MTTPPTLTVGTFSFSPGVPRWCWSDGLFALHGLEPGEVVPTRALFLTHVHPQDRPRVEQELDTCALDGQPDGCAYRLVDLSGRERTVLLALDLRPGPEGQRVWGLVVDDTERHRAAVAEEVNDELRRALESHAVIDQAKGVLMAVYGVDGEKAFEVMRQASQQRNVRLREVAERLIGAVQANGGLGPVERAAMDDTFLAVLDGTLVPCPHRGRPSLDLTLDQRPDRPTLQVAGTVELVSMGELVSALHRLMAAGVDQDGVVVDLSGVDRVGSALRSVLVAAVRRCEARGVWMDVVADPGTVLAVGATAATGARPGGGRVRATVESGTGH